MAFISQIWKRKRDETIQSASLTMHHHHPILLSPLHLSKRLLLCYLLGILLLVVLLCPLHMVHLSYPSLIVNLLHLLLVVRLSRLPLSKGLLHLPLSKGLSCLPLSEGLLPLHLSEGLLLLSLVLALVSQHLMEVPLLQILWRDLSRPCPTPDSYLVTPVASQHCSSTPVLCALLRSWMRTYPSAKCDPLHYTQSSRYHTSPSTLLYREFSVLRLYLLPCSIFSGPYLFSSDLT